MAGGGKFNMGGCAIIGVLLLAAIGSCAQQEAEEVSASTSTKYVSARSLNCRASDEADAAVVASFKRDDAVSVAEQRGEWSRLEGANKCWVASRYLSENVGGWGGSPSGEAAAGAVAAGGAAALMSGSGSESPRGSSSSSGSAGSSGVSQASSYESSRGRSYVSGKSSLSKKKKMSRKQASFKKKRSAKRGKKRSGGYSSGNCPCRGGNVCIGPRGGRYCITSGGNKRYGV